MNIKVYKLNPNKKRNLTFLIKIIINYKKHLVFTQIPIHLLDRKLFE